MTVAALTVQNIVPTGLSPTLAAANAGGNSFPCPGDERTYFRIKNADSGSHTATIKKQQSSVRVPGIGTLALADVAVAVPAGEERVIGPFSGAYIDATGSVQVTYDAVTSVTVGAFYLGKAD
jgi:hypothetical protein